MVLCQKNGTKKAKKIAEGNNNEVKIRTGLEIV